MFLAPKIFWGKAPKFWTGIIKLGLVLITVQNFTPVGPRIIEISRLKKNKLEIWGKAQRESARRPKSDWGKLGKGNFPGIKIHLETCQVPKFRRTTSPNSEVIMANLLNFKPIVDPLLKKVVRGPPSQVGGALVRLGHSLARVKIWRRSTR